MFHFTHLKAVCIFGQATEGVFQAGSELLLGGCVSTYKQHP